MNSNAVYKETVPLIVPKRILAPDSIHLIIQDAMDALSYANPIPTRLVAFLLCPFTIFSLTMTLYQPKGRYTKSLL